MFGSWVLNPMLNETEFLILIDATCPSEMSVILRSRSSIHYQPQGLPYFCRSRQVERPCLVVR